MESKQKVRKLSTITPDHHHLAMTRLLLSVCANMMLYLIGGDIEQKETVKMCRLSSAIAVGKCLTSSLSNGAQ